MKCRTCTKTLDNGDYRIVCKKCMFRLISDSVKWRSYSSNHLTYDEQNQVFSESLELLIDTLNLYRLNY